jgi:hypothetical protein
MLDTLKLSLTEYSVSSDAQFQVQPGLVDNASGELLGNNRLWSAGGHTVTGSRAWHNGEHFNITIKPNPHAPGGLPLCLVQFSVPKVATGSNFRAVDADGTSRALRAAQKYLREIGVKTKLATAAVSRLDAFRNLECVEPFAAYHPVLATLQGPRMRRRDYGRTLLWENTLQELCAYDKREEMVRNKHSVEGLPPNPLRFEARALKMQKVRAWLGIERAGQLPDALPHIEQQYREVMRKQLFKGEVSQASKLTQGQINEQLAAAKEHCGQRWFEAWWHAVAVNALGDDLEAVKAAIHEQASTRQAALKMSKKLEDAKLDAMATSILGSSRRPLGELYTELREKVLA